MYTLSRVLKALRWLLARDPSHRRRVKKELARISANLFGDHYLGDDCKIWREDINFRSDFKRLSPHNVYSEERKYTLREFARYTEHLSGAMAECGCYTGVSAYFLAQSSPSTPLYLFDSFEGLSQPSDSDLAPDDMQSWRAGDLSTTTEALQENLSQFPNINIMKGWIPERFPEIENLQFRLIHIDVDLYQPTLDSLSFFYPRMVPGGVIIMDDYGFLNCPGANRAAHEFMSDKADHIIHLTTGQGVIIIPS